MTNKEIYERALRLVDSKSIAVYTYMRYCALPVCDILFDICYQRQIPFHGADTFPEWYAQKPPGVYYLWWPITDRESRKNALRKAIKLCDDAAQ